MGGFLAGFYVYSETCASVQPISADIIQIVLHDRTASIIHILRAMRPSNIVGITPFLPNLLTIIRRLTVFRLQHRTATLPPKINKTPQLITHPRIPPRRLQQRQRQKRHRRIRIHHRRSHQLIPNRLPRPVRIISTIKTDVFEEHTG